MTVLVFTGCSSIKKPEGPVMLSVTEQELVLEENRQDVKSFAIQDGIDGLFGISGVNVAKYRIKGEGPDGAFFDWIEVTEPRVAIADVRRGEWVIYAEGLNEKGEVMVKGKLNTFLSSDTPLDNLVLSPREGTGNAYCDLTWNPVQVRKPVVEIYLQDEDGNFAARDSAEISGENGRFMWQAFDIRSGSYIARFVLKDGSSTIGGAAAALRIIEGRTSVGSVNLKVGDLSTVFGINIQNTPQKTVVGSLFLKEDKIVFESATGFSSSEYDYEWFVDGVKRENQNYSSVSIKDLGLDKGISRVDLIIHSSQYGSINSYTLDIEIDKNGKAGVKSVTTWYQEPVKDAGGIISPSLGGRSLIE